MSVIWDPEAAAASVPSTEAALFMLVREMHPVRTIATFTILGEPVVKARARFVRRGAKTHAYTPDSTCTAEEQVGWLFKKAAPGHHPDAEYEYGLFAIFFCAKRQKRDVDNMLKLLSDGLNGGRVGR